MPFHTLKFENNPVYETIKSLFEHLSSFIFNPRDGAACAFWLSADARRSLAAAQGRQRRRTASFSAENIDSKKTVFKLDSSTELCENKNSRKLLSSESFTNFYGDKVRFKFSAA